MTLTGSEESHGQEHPPVRILITGGGTGGHVYPGLAVAGALENAAPGSEVRFAGTARGIESVLVPAAGYRLTTLPASGLRGLGGRARIMFLVNFMRGYFRSLLMFLAWRPRLVLGTGGYVSAPVMLAARTVGITCALQEQNSIPGSTNRLVGRWAKRIYLGFAGAAQYFKAERCRETGNPVRSEFLDPGVTKQDEAPRTGHRLLIFGGSRGAATLNEAAKTAAEAWTGRPDLAVLIQTGPRDRESVAAAYSGADADRFEVVAYILDMASALRAADLVVCRAGAMTLAELQALGKPAVLVPFPFATDDHQLHNAEDCEGAGAAVVLTDAACNGPALVALVDGLFDDPDRLRHMGESAAKMARPEAAAVIAADLLNLIGSAEKH